MKELRPLDTRGPFAFRPHHWRMLFGGFILIGLLMGLLLVHMIYDVWTDPYSYPFGNTRENPWIYASQGVYLSVAIFCLLLDIIGTALIIAGQLIEKRKLSLIGVVLVFGGIVITLATRLVE